MTIITTQQSGKLMRGKPVPIESKTICAIGARDWKKPIIGIYYDVMGYENGTKTWILVHVLRRSFSLWVLRLSQFHAERRAKA